MKYFDFYEKRNEECDRGQFRISYIVSINIMNMYCGVLACKVNKVKLP